MKERHGLDAEKAKTSAEKAKTDAELAKIDTLPVLEMAR